MTIHNIEWHEYDFNSQIYFIVKVNNQTIYEDLDYDRASSVLQTAFKTLRALGENYLIHQYRNGEAA